MASTFWSHGEARSPGLLSLRVTRPVAISARQGQVEGSWTRHPQIAGRNPSLPFGSSDSLSLFVNTSKCHAKTDVSSDTRLTVISETSVHRIGARPRRKRLVPAHSVSEGASLLTGPGRLCERLPQVVDWTDDQPPPHLGRRRAGGVLLLLGGSTCTGSTDRRGQGGAGSRPSHRLCPPLRRYRVARRDVGGIRVAVLSATVVQDEHADVSEARVHAPSLGPVGTRYVAGT